MMKREALTPPDSSSLQEPSQSFSLPKGPLATPENATAIAELKRLGAKLRDARLNARAQQKALSKAIMEGTADRGSKEHRELSAAAAGARDELRVAQEELMRARKKLPPGIIDPSIQEEAGVEAALSSSPEQRHRPPGRTLGHSIGVEYQKCQALAQLRNGERRETSLSNLALPADERGARFTKKARKAIPQSVIDEIRSRNLLDTKLHERALEILARNRDKWTEDGSLGKLPVLPPLPPPSNQNKPKQKFRIQKPTDARPTEL
jgi:hypothetical protein